MTEHIRVSEILSQFRDYSKINPTVLAEKCEIGTETHDNIKRYNTGGFEMFEMFPLRDMHGEIKTRSDGTQSWEERGKPYFQSYREWDKKVSPKFSIMEERYYDDNLMITGQIDALMTTDTLPVLVDFKCSANADLEMWSMQGHYYKHLLEQNGILIADHFLFIKLLPNAKFPVVHEIKFDEKVHARCIYEAILYWEKINDAKKIAE